MADTDGSLTKRSIASFSTISILKVVAVFLTLYFLYIIRDIILLVVISVIISSGLTPLVEWLNSKARFPRALTVILVYIVFIGVVALIFSLIIPRLLEEFGALGNNIESIRGGLTDQGSSLHDLLDKYGFSNFLASISTAIAQFTSDLFQKTISLFSSLFNFITILVMSFYLVIEQDGMKKFIKSITPLHHQVRIANAVVEVQHRLGRWLVGQLALMVCIFALDYAGLLALHVKYALILALFAGLMEVVPFLGPIISAIPAILISLLQSVPLAVGVIVLYTIMQQAENYLLAPRIIGKSVGANPLIILVALLIGLKIAGIAGMLISAPIVAILTVVVDEVQSYWRSDEYLKSA